jgi:hypothetical protein
VRPFGGEFVDVRRTEMPTRKMDISQPDVVGIDKNDVWPGGSGSIPACEYDHQGGYNVYGNSIHGSSPVMQRCDIKTDSKLLRAVIVKEP